MKRNSERTQEALQNTLHSVLCAGFLTRGVTYDV
jgi:hypothetical protein